MTDAVVFTTQWFDLIARSLDDGAPPHYAIRTLDYVSVIALTPAREFVLVRQYRPAVGMVTVELPGGHVEPAEQPEEAARKELLGETGYVTDRMMLLGTLAPDTGRLANRLWCYLADPVRPAPSPRPAPEAGIEVVSFAGGVDRLVAEVAFCSALNYAALFLAALQGRLDTSPAANCP